MSSPRARSRNSARAVRKMIGMSRVRSSSRSRSATCHPSSCGIITSRRITSGCSARAFSIPLGPSSASSTFMPSASRLTRQRRRIGASSSMTSTFVIAREPRVGPAFSSGSVVAGCTGGGLYTRLLRNSLLHTAGVAGEWELEDEVRALSFGGLDPNLSSHRRDEAAGDEEPEAGAATVRAACATVELAEDPLPLRLRDADSLVGHTELDRVAAAARGDGDGAARRRELDRVVEQVREDLAELVAIGLRREPAVLDVDDEAVPVPGVVVLVALHRVREQRLEVDRRELHLEIARVEPGHVEERVDDLREPFRLRGDVADEGRALGFAEERVAAQERLCEAVDRRQRRAQLVGDRRHEVGLHLLDEAVRGDVAEGEDPAGDLTAGVAHDGLGEREGELAPATPDRHLAVALRRAVVRLELALEELRRLAAERLGRADAGDPLRGTVPEDDGAFAVDGDDPVGDVREDRVVALLLDGDALVELCVRERGRGVGGQGDERLDLLLAPRAGAPGVDGEHTAQDALRPEERHAEERTLPAPEQGGGGARAIVGRRVAERGGGARLDAPPEEPGERGAARRERHRTRLAGRRDDDELGLLQEVDRARVRTHEGRRLARDLVQHRGGVELARERAAGLRELLRERAGGALRLEEAAALKGSAGSLDEVARQLEILVHERPRLLEEDEDEPCLVGARVVDRRREERGVGVLRGGAPDAVEALVPLHLRRGQELAGARRRDEDAGVGVEAGVEELRELLRHPLRPDDLETPAVREQHRGERPAERVRGGVPERVHRPREGERLAQRGRDLVEAALHPRLAVALLERLGVLERQRRKACEGIQRRLRRRRERSLLARERADDAADLAAVLDRRAEHGCEPAQRAGTAYDAPRGHRGRRQRVRGLLRADARRIRADRGAAGERGTVVLERPALGRVGADDAHDLLDQPREDRVDLELA